MDLARRRLLVRLAAVCLTATAGLAVWVSGGCSPWADGLSQADPPEPQQDLAAELPREVVVPLEQRRLHAAAREQVGEDRSAWARPDDDRAAHRYEVGATVKLRCSRRPSEKSL